MGMIVTIIRVLIAFLVATIAAAVTLVAFVFTTDLFTDDIDRLASAGMLVLYMATIATIFAAPLALVAAVIGEWQAIRNWAFYALAGLAIAIAGFIAQYTTEVGGGGPSIVNNYALAAFLASGLIGGGIYWLLAGRYAGGFLDVDEDGDDESDDEPRRPSGAPPRRPGEPYLHKV
jgi:hypothetical protein